MSTVATDGQKGTPGSGAGPYKLTQPGSIPGVSIRHFTRLAARSNTARAQPFTFPPEAALISSNSASVSFIKNAGLSLTSSGSFGRPTERFLAISVYPDFIQYPLVSGE